MKKLSVSLFAVLAIVFAVSSAFTTKSKYTDNNKWEQFGVPNDLYTPGSGVSTIYGARIGDTFKQVFDAAITDVQTQITAYNNAHPFEAQVSCSSDVDQMCGAIVSYLNTSSNQLTLIATKNGDYSLSL